MELVMNRERKKRRTRDIKEADVGQSDDDSQSEIKNNNNNNMKADCLFYSLFCISLFVLHFLFGVLETSNVSVTPTCMSITTSDDVLCTYERTYLVPTSFYIIIDLLRTILLSNRTVLKTNNTRLTEMKPRLSDCC